MSEKASAVAAAQPGPRRFDSDAREPSTELAGPVACDGALPAGLGPFPATGRDCDRDLPVRDRTASRRNGAVWRTSGSVARRAAGAARTGAVAQSEESCLGRDSRAGELRGSPAGSQRRPAFLAASDIKKASTVAWRCAAAAASASPPRAGRLGRQRLAVRDRGLMLAPAPRTRTCGRAAAARSSNSPVSQACGSPLRREARWAEQAAERARGSRRVSDSTCRTQRPVPLAAVVRRSVVATAPGNSGSASSPSWGRRQLNF